MTAMEHSTILEIRSRYEWSAEPARSQAPAVRSALVTTFYTYLQPTRSPNSRVTSRQIDRQARSLADSSPEPLEATACDPCVVGRVFRISMPEIILDQNVRLGNALITFAIFVMSPIGPWW